MNRINTKYRNRQGDIALTAFRVIDKMENNEDFPDPPAALAALKETLPKYDKSLADAMGGDKFMMAQKDELKMIMVDLLQVLVDYVTVTSRGDRTTMLSSGFEVASENGNGKLPPAIEKLEVELGEPGEAKIRIRNVTNTIAYIHEYTNEPPNLQTNWVSHGSSWGSYTFRRLSTGDRYWFRVVAIGYHGQIGYSPVVSRIIQ